MSRINNSGPKTSNLYRPSINCIPVVLGWGKGGGDYLGQHSLHVKPLELACLFLHNPFHRGKRKFSLFICRSTMGEFLDICTLQPSWWRNSTFLHLDIQLWKKGNPKDTLGRRFFIPRELKKRTNRWLITLPMGSLLPSRANAREAQTLEDFQRDYIRLGFCVNR